MINGKIQRYSAGIYKITNLVNNKFYIGSSVNLYNRFHTHKTKLKQNIHVNKHLQNSFNKYGKNNFLFTVLEYCDKNLIQDREQYYLDKLLPNYNHRKVAHINLGISPTRETRQKISKTLKLKYKNGLISFKNENKWRAINVFDLEGNLIKKYDSIMQTVYELGIKKANLRRALNNKGRAGNYQFRDITDSYPGKYNPLINQHTIKNKTNEI